MKTPLLCVGCILLSLLLVGCGNGKQRRLYQTAVEMEQQQEPLIALEAYRDVIRVDPVSQWTAKAQARIDVIQQKISAQQLLEEQHRTRVQMLLR